MQEADVLVQPHGVGTRLTTFRLICSTDTHAAQAAVHEPDISPGQGGSLAHPQPRVPHKAYHGDVHRTPVAAASSALQTAAPLPGRGSCAVFLRTR